MIAILAAKSAFSVRKEVGVVLITLSVLIFMPVAAVFAMTNAGGIGDGAILYTGNALTTNTYDYGYCTFWAALRREEVGKPIPNTFGDAHTWEDRALLAGYTVNKTPAPHAIMQSNAGELGHVAFVESVAPDGSWTISEMNYKGWNIMSGRTMKPAEALFYNFIH